jgi:hypothetical protein
MEREVAEDEIIGAWLRNELPKKWSQIRQYLNSNIEDEYVHKLIKNPDYSDDFENRFRLELLFSFRSSLLLSIIGAKWFEMYLDESEFKKLKVINEAGWNIVSDFSGDISKVAKNIDHEKVWEKNPILSRAIKAIHEKEKRLENDKLDGKIFLVRSQDSAHTTIFEGNKTAIALFRKVYYKQNLQYKPIKVFIGFLKSKSFWQW